MWTKPKWVGSSVGGREGEGRGVVEGKLRQLYLNNNKKYKNKKKENMVCI